jgi:hypothetical protein
MHTMAAKEGFNKDIMTEKRTGRRKPSILSHRQVTASFARPHSLACLCFSYQDICPTYLQLPFLPISRSNPELMADLVPPLILILLGHRQCLTHLFPSKNLAHSRC